MTTPTATPAAWYPQMPPVLPGEDADAYTDRLTGADRADRVPYDHYRGRQCSIGYHGGCSDPAGVTCRCPCHRDETVEMLAHAAAQLGAPDSLTLRFTAATATWGATVVIGGVPTESAAATPTAALTATFRALDWMG